MSRDRPSARRRALDLIRVGVRELYACVMEIRLLFARRCSWRTACPAAVRTAAAWREGLVLGLLAAIPWTLVGWGAQHVDAGVTAIANAAVPIFVAVIAVKALPGERVTGMRLAGVLLGLAGVALLAGAYPQGGWWGVAGPLGRGGGAGVRTRHAVRAASARREPRDRDLRPRVGDRVAVAVRGATQPGHLPSAKAFTAAVVLGVLSPRPPTRSSTGWSPRTGRPARRSSRT